MRWAALYRRPPILRGVSASQIRADHAAKQARINATLSSMGLAQPDYSCEVGISPAMVGHCWCVYREQSAKPEALPPVWVSSAWNCRRMSLPFQTYGQCL